MDRFGNLTTNLLEADIAALGARGLEGLEVTLGAQALPLVRSYSDVEPGEACALVGVERPAGDSRATWWPCADARFGAGRGTRVGVRRPGFSMLHSG